MKHQIQLKPFLTPSFAIAETPAGNRQQGFQELPSYPLSELSPETLHEMCAAFRAEVFKKAGKTDDWGAKA